VSTVSVLEVFQDILDSARLTPSELKVQMALHCMPKDACPSARRASWLT